MKVSIAAQTPSASVAHALDFLRVAQWLFALHINNKNLCLVHIFY